jgi:T5SS/PEP-CTERM-associated repeat protein
MGSGDLQIAGGGSAVVSGFDSQVYVGSGGIIDVDGAGSSLDIEAGSTVTLGFGGSGTLDLSNGGSAQIAFGLSVGSDTLETGSGVVEITNGSQAEVTTLGLFNNSTVSVDASSGLVVGAGGSAVAGAIVVNNDPLFSANATIAASVVDNAPGIPSSDPSVVNGTMEVAGSLEITGTLSGSGFVNIDNGGTLQVDGAVDPTSAGVIFDTAGLTQPYTSLMANETLILQTPGTAFAPALQLIAGSKVELGAGIQITGASLQDGSLVVSGSISYAFDNVSFFAPSASDDTVFVPGTPTGFATGFDSSTGDYYVQVETVDPNAPIDCFVEGTLIETEDGAVPVERLRVGQCLPTVLGGEPAPVVWIGRRDVVCGQFVQPRAVWPVRVAAGALGPGMPARDVWLSPDHAVYLDEVLVPVRCLINGTTIVQVPRARVTYYHVELPRHDVVLADGLPVESFLDTGNRGFFGEAGHSAGGWPARHARMWDALGCAPLIVGGARLQALRARVASAELAA